jgi:hypothetical protein
VAVSNRQAVRPGEVVDLAPAWGDDWDRLLIFDGEPPEPTIDSALGFHWSNYTPSMGDGTTILMVQGSSVVRWGYLPAMNDAREGQYTEFMLAGPWVELHPDEPTAIIRGDGPVPGPIILCVEVCPSDR